MLKQQFLQEIESANLMLHSSGYKSIDYICNAIHKGIFVPEVIEQTIISTNGELLGEGTNGDNANPFDRWQSGSIAIIPLAGVMLKYGYWWSYGVDDIAAIIGMAYASDKIDSVIIKADTPGGNTDSLFYLQEILSLKTKPTYGFIDGMCASCGYIAFSYMDKIYSINRMARVGGIGVFARILIPNRENAYYEVKEVYPDESPDKNKPEREFAEGNDELIKEELSKLATYFIDLVKESRPKIASESLTGKTYYSYEAESLGMIDGIRSLSEVIDELTTLTESRKKILTFL
jgi:ClpP class serine protease